MRIITQSEAQIPASSTNLNVTLTDKADNVLYTQATTEGNFLSPHAGTLYWIRA